MKHIAIIGFGVVGGGITEVIESNREKLKEAVGDDVNVKYILDLRDFPDSPYGDRVVHDITPILNDSEVSLVCETMGGSHPAFEFSEKCMKAGKSVVTSNKEVVANFGDKLLECAKENNVTYMFEASVGGGIPCIRPFYSSLSYMNLSKICGIVNGTTNFILTKMKNEKRDFEDVLAEAQKLGYAEKNPSADIDGVDAKRKIIILSALASGVLAGEDEVVNETLRTITQEDLKAAQMLDGEIKYIANATFGEQNEVFVCPMIVKHSHPLSGVSDVYNAISVKSDLTGDIMFYGKGAGRYPTAGAVVSDVVAVLSGAVDNEKVPVFEKKSGGIKNFDEIKFDCYVRCADGVDGLQGKLGDCVTSVEKLSDTEALVKGLSGIDCKARLSGDRIIRILE